MRTWHLAVGLALLPVTAFTAGRLMAAPAALPDRPHIVLFISDDHGWADSGPYGAEDVRTPNLDRLAEQSMRLTRAFAASPTCTPSRSVIYTGLMPFRNGAHANHSSTRPQLRSLPHYLKELGYRVVLAGKVHVKPREVFPFEYLGDSNRREPGKGPGLYTDLHTPAVDKLLAEHEKRTPLCLVVCSHSPHVYWPENQGYHASNVDLPPYLIDTPVTRRARTRYYTDVTLMDKRLGEVMDSLERHGYAEETLLVYTSDQGAQWPHAKWNLYDAGIRTPLLVRWSGKVGPGSTSEAMVGLVDLLPTFIEAAGGTPPEELDGRSFLPVLLGRKSAHRQAIFAAHTGDGKMNRTPIRCIRTATHKYVLNLRPGVKHTTHITNGRDPDGRDYWDSWIEKARTDPHAARLLRFHQERPAEELYDLTADPHELKNIADDPANAELVAALRRKLAAWRNEQGDPELAADPRTNARRPNVIFIFIDDMGFGDLSCYGNRKVRTPNIDRLAKEGIRFTGFYVNSPICSPSRVAVTTGQYPARHRINSYLETRKRNRERHMADFLDPDVPAVARTFHQAGYATAHFGKWHMGGGRDVDDAPLPQAYGFDESLVSFEGLGDRVLPPGARKSEQLGRGKISHAPKHQLTEIYVDRSIDFIRRRRQQPFYLHLWLNDVHDAHVPKPGAAEQYKQITDNPYEQKFFAVLVQMDRQIGRLIDAVEELKLTRHTLILLAGDNGPTDWPMYYRAGQAPPGSAGPFRGRKWSLYEGGIRVPFIARWQGTIPAGRVNDQTVIAGIDLFPTLCALAEINPPEGVRFDGEDLSGALFGQTPLRRKPIMWEYRRDDTYLKPGKAEFVSPNLAIRQDNWKLLVNADGSGVELYDLGKDPGETTNVASHNPQLVQRLSQRVLAWRGSLP